MRIGIVGNNDGPLILLRSLAHRQLAAAWVGLQKPVPPKMLENYSTLATDISQEIDEPWILAKLVSQPVDVLVNCFCNFRFSKTLERVPVLNVHLSYLPSYRGRHPLHWALINGETEHGVTIHRMTEKMDAGEIYWQEKVAVKSGSSVRQLRENLLGVLENHFGKFMIQWHLGNAPAEINPDTDSTWFPGRKPQDSRLIEWHDRDKMYRKVMALRSEVEHQAYLFIDGKKRKVDFAGKPPSNFSNTKDRVVGIGRDIKSIMLKCDDNNLIILHFVETLPMNITHNSKIT
ncbi:MAG: formyltransferase family protein [Bacteroidia bacterium]